MRNGYLTQVYILLICVLFIAVSANATPVKFDFSGTVTSQAIGGYGPLPWDFELNQFIAVGNMFSGSMTFDPETAYVIHPTDSYNIFNIHHMDLNVTFSKGYVYYGGGFPQAQVTGGSVSNCDIYSLGVFNSQEVQSYDIWLSEVDLRFNSSPGVDLDDFIMPDFLSSNLFGQSGYFNFRGAGDSCIEISVSLDATSASPVPTPEPATVMLVSTGLIGLLGIRKRKSLHYVIRFPRTGLT